MKFEVLGCSGTDVPGHQLTSFRIDSTILMDAGSVTCQLSMEDQAQITDIFVTHPHLDHIKDILFLADNLIELVVKQDHSPINIWGLESVLQSIRNNLLNDTIWPDFTMLPAIDKPVIAYKSMLPEEIKMVNGYQVATCPVNHGKSASGFVLWKGDGSSNVAYTGDTGPTSSWWKFLNNLPFDIQNLVIESSFPNELEKVATISQHLTPMLLRMELNKLKTKPKVFITHMKTSFLDTIQQELEYALDGYSYHLLSTGEVFDF